MRWPSCRLKYDVTSRDRDPSDLTSSIDVTVVVRHKIFTTKREHYGKKVSIQITDLVVWRSNTKLTRFFIGENDRETAWGLRLSIGSRFKRETETRCLQCPLRLLNSLGEVQVEKSWKACPEEEPADWLQLCHISFSTNTNDSERAVSSPSSNL